MKELFQEIKDGLDRGESAVMVTIIASSGSTPRGAGSRMLVKEDGTIRGTVGGGAVEYQAILTAQKALKERCSCIKEFSLTRNQVADIGMVCGGDVTVYFQYLSSSDQAFRHLCGEILKALKQDEDSWLMLDITEEGRWQMGLYSRDGGFTGIPEAGENMEGKADPSEEPPERDWKSLFTIRTTQGQLWGRKYYIEPLVQAGTVYVFGGGHVAQELVPVLHHVGFRCVVMDDREEFANPQVFPDAEKTIVGDLERVFDYVTIRECDYVCIMTRGHQFDYYIQRQVMALHPCYIGIMGSRNKIRVVTEKLLGDGYTREEIEACRMPIGTEIYAETPAEIAISIAGELIAVRAERMGRKK